MSSNSNYDLIFSVLVEQIYSCSDFGNEAEHERWHHSFQGKIFNIVRAQLLFFNFGLTVRFYLNPHQDTAAVSSGQLGVELLHVLLRLLAGVQLGPIEVDPSELIDGGPILEC